MKIDVLKTPGPSGSYLTDQNLTEGPRENQSNPSKELLRRHLSITSDDVEFALGLLRSISITSVLSKIFAGTKTSSSSVFLISNI
jgi:hypothetical protein